MHREGETETEVGVEGKSLSVGSSGCNNQSWTRLKSGAKSFIQFFHKGRGVQVLGPSSAAFLHNCRELVREWSSPCGMLAFPVAA